MCVPSIVLHHQDNGDEEDESSEDDEDDDMDVKADEEEEEEHPAPVVVAPTAADQAPSVEETEPFETDEYAATPPPHPAYRVTARISIPAPVTLPPRKRLDITLGPRYEVGESSSAAAARPAGDVSDLVHGKVMSLRTTMLGQMSEIKELQAADRRRQTLILSC
nr:hypothetical protein [Tanacetum cinerariifolium]